MQARWQAHKIAPTPIRSRNFSSEERAARFSQTLQRAWHAFFEEAQLRTPVNNIEYFPPNFEGLVLGCIDADFCK